MFKLEILSKIFEKQNLQKSATKNGKTIVAEYLAKNPKAKEIQPFCQKIWSEADLKRYRRCRITGNVTHHGYLNGINHHLTTGVNPKGLTKQFLCTGITPKEMIEITDKEFKVLPKLKEDLKAFRCVNEKPDFSDQYKRYAQSLKIKKGDIIRMPEYAYATSDIEYAKIYLPDNKGIIYDILIPKGARVSKTGYGINNEIVFPRCSQFECVGTEQQGEAFIVKLKYIKPVDVAL